MAKKLFGLVGVIVQKYVYCNAERGAVQNKESSILNEF